MTEPERPSVSSGSTSTAEKLCFDKNEFLKENFSVDEFLHKNRNAPSLEQLRDNLGLYLKDLRAAMIDLINEDYADFVNLSANLVGLDQSIDKIRTPLEQFRSDIEDIHALIDDNVFELRALLEEKRKLREMARSLQSLKRVNEITDRLQALLNLKLNGVQNPMAVDLERAALHLIQLQFHEQHCAELISCAQETKIAKVEEQVHKNMRCFFMESQERSYGGCPDDLERCLRIFITLDACERAEHFFCQDIVAPYMSVIIGEQQLQNSPQGLAGIYSKILNFVSIAMPDLLRLTLYSDQLNGFNFVVNSFWVDVETRLELHMNSIFAPGNSDVFYVKYKCTRDFMAKIEDLLISSRNGPQAVAYFRQHPQTLRFEARWNLPVYYQICFQNIGGRLEEHLEPLLLDNSLKLTPDFNGFHLAPFKVTKLCLLHCWADGTFIPEIFDKFYKLNVQLVLRLSRWIRNTIQVVQNDAIKDYTAAYTREQLLVYLHVDIRTMAAYLPELVKMIADFAPRRQDVIKIVYILGRSMGNVGDTLTENLPVIQDTLKQLLISECGTENVRQVNDLPRLYRKTNREVPTRCSGYVEQMMRPLTEFVKKYEANLGALVVEQILAEVCSHITNNYYNVVKDVLTSVQKTEESLRRLRNLKIGNAPSTSANINVTVSDDDKIRLQLRCDVAAWTLELSNLNFQPAQIDKLLELSNLVEDSIKPKEEVA